MSKQRIDGYIQEAIELLQVLQISQNGKIPKTFRGYISSFGAAITMGGLRSAIAFNSKQGGADLERQKLMEVIYRLIKNENESDDKKLLNYVIEKDNDAELKDEILDAAIAVKLAMNMYHLD